MTFTDDFAPIEGVDDFEEGPSYPTVFGIEFNPTAQGIGVAILGIAIAVGIFVRLVQPVTQERTDLADTVAQKEAELARQRELLADEEELLAELEEAIEQRVGIYSLLGTPSSLDTLLLDINQQIQGTNAGLGAALGGALAPMAQILRSEEVEEADIRAFYTAELRQFNPAGSSGIVNDGTYGPELDGKLERQVVNVSFSSLFDQGQAILRNLERLEPLLLIRDFNQTWTSPVVPVPDIALRRITRPITTTFTLEVLVPVGDPTEIPEPPPPEPTPEEGETVEGEAPPP